GALGNVDRRLIRGLERVTIGDLTPDLTFILDVPAEVGLARAGRRRGGDAPDRFEQETLDFHEKLREAYREIAENEPQRCVLVDATRGKDIVTEAIWNIVNARLDPTLAPIAVEDVAS
ncbi:MAG: thymidylate kinase, partial [Proteobacteria bacterium]|nr:thymidylate kinase [Pseudomonadota bacterium]